MKLIFAGTPDFARAHLQTILDHSPHQVLAVYSQPDRPAGRGKQLRPSPVKALALEHGLAVYQPPSLRTAAAQEELAGLDADLMVVVAYGLILPRQVLDTPRFGCINVHASLLPRWRGAAPIQHAIAAGDTQTGVNIMKMDAGLDTGAVLAEQAVPIDADETTGSLQEKLIPAGCSLLLDTLDRIPGIYAQAHAQDDSRATYAGKITAAIAALDWSQPAIVLERWIRALNPAPGAYSLLDGERIKVWGASLASGSGSAGSILNVSAQGIEVACGQGSLLLTRLQPAGRTAMNAADLLRGHANQFAPGRRFSSGSAT